MLNDSIQVTSPQVGCTVLLRLVLAPQNACACPRYEITCLEFIEIISVSVLSLVMVTIWWFIIYSCENYFDFK